MKKIDSTLFANVFRESAPYIHAFKGQTFVIYLTFQTLQSNNLRSIIHDIALLHSLGVKIIIVFNALSTSDTEQPNQLTITNLIDLKALKQQNGLFRAEIEALFSSSLPNTPMHNTNIHTVSGNFIVAKPLGIIDGIDYQFSGIIRKTHHQTINQLLENQQIVLLSNLAYSSTGECFHLAAEAVASQVASSLRASKLIVYADHKTLSHLSKEVQPEQAKKAFAKHPSYPLQALIQGCKQGIERNHLINFEEDGALLQELFSRDGSGILLSETAFETIENATIEDVGGIMALLRPLEQKGILVKREREKLEQEITHFVVIKRDNMIIACAALYPFGEDFAEIACVATHQDYQGNHRGANMLNHLEKKAIQQKISTLFVLTTQSAHFFLEKGYQTAPQSWLPKARQAMYNQQRQSKVFIKKVPQPVSFD